METVAKLHSFAMHSWWIKQQNKRTPTTTDCIADYYAKSSERYPLLANRFITESAPLSLSGCCCSNANPL